MTTDINQIAKGLSEKFWPNIAMAENGCWAWTGRLTYQGYGHLSFARRVYRAHRVSLLIHGEHLRDDLVCDHICRNRRCVNPNHLRQIPSALNVLCGDGVSARNARKTHCVRGHPLTGTNLFTTASTRGWRICAECTRVRKNAYRAAKRRALRTHLKGLPND